jgi:hypothetical protein
MVSAGPLHFPMLAVAFLGNNRYQIIPMDLATDKDVVGVRLDTITGKMAVLYYVKDPDIPYRLPSERTKVAPYEYLRLRHIDSSVITPY